MEYILKASKIRTADTVTSVRFSDNKVWTGTKDGLLLELLDRDGNVQGNTTISQTDILALARALK